MKAEQKQIWALALEKFGTTAQLDMAVEECAELIQAINKIKRADIVRYHITKPNASMLLKSVNAYNNLCSEIADVKIMLAQLEMMLDPERVEISLDRKISRLAARLRKLGAEPPGGWLMHPYA